MMQVEPYNKQAHLETLNQWCEAHNKHPFPAWWLPSTGFVVPGVIAAFLYATDSGLAFVECVISNPKSTHAERQQALDLIDQALTEHARKHGIRALQGQTRIATVRDASERNGWVASKPAYSILLKLIGDE